jgi:antirestriction protein ArdC
MNDKLRTAHDKLQNAVAEIVSGDEWKRMLKIASKFHRYSFNNHLMIFLQRPDATVVAGFNRWKSLGRFVKKGEKGIAIFAPCRYKTKVETDAGEETVQQIRGFRVVHVFDISQTEGEELPDLDAVRPRLLDADAPEGIWDALVAQAAAAGFEVIRKRRGSENGYCDFSSKQIGVRPDVAPAQAIKTLIHELGHALLHSDELPRSKEVAEVEVESVAYIVCDAIGLDSGDYSFAYVARWSDGATELIKDTAERVIGCSKQILEALEASDHQQEGSKVADSNAMRNQIVSARITDLPKKIGDPLPEVWATFQDGTDKMLFTYYPDEISFQAQDFIGLTEEEATLFKFGRDRAYLQTE